jgi:hypothetical protein
MKKVKTKNKQSVEDNKCMETIRTETITPGIGNDPATATDEQHVLVPKIEGKTKKDLEKNTSLHSKKGSKKGLKKGTGTDMGTKEQGVEKNTKSPERPKRTCTNKSPVNKAV